jgi:sugar phosphate permease
MDPTEEKAVSNQKKQGKIFFGWWTVFATSIINFWGYGVWGYGFSVYFKPLMTEFNWTRAETSIAASVGSLEGGIEGPFGGIATDKYGPRAVNFVGIFLAGLGFLMLYFVNNLWSFILIWGLVVSTGMNLGMTGPLYAAISNWFVKKRGKAFGVATASLGLGGAVIAPLMSILVYSVGWRFAFVVAGLITWTVGLPLTWFCVKPHRPEYYGLLPDGEDPMPVEGVGSMLKAGQDYAGKLGEFEFTVRQVLKTPAFWMLTVVSMIRGVGYGVIRVHQIPFLTDMGIDPTAAATILGFWLFVSVPGRFFGGVLLDRLHIDRMRYLIMSALTLEGIGVFFLSRATSLELIYVFDLFYGLGFGFFQAYFIMFGRYFGRKSFATVSGIRSIISLPVGVVAPIYAGWVFDITGSYLTALNIGILCYVLGIAATFFAKPPKRPFDG